MLMQYFVYILASKNRNYFYTGLSSDVASRLERHNRGYEKTTKPYRPFELVFTETCESRTEARKREKYWKSGSGREKIKQMVRRNITPHDE